MTDQERIALMALFGCCLLAALAVVATIVFGERFTQPLL
jgi:hypothetical protein